MSQTPPNADDPQGDSKSPLSGVQHLEIKSLPPVSVFEDKMVQVFMQHQKPEGVFASSQMSQTNGVVRLLNYTIKYTYVPAKNKKPARLELQLRAAVTDLANTSPDTMISPLESAKASLHRAIEEIERLQPLVRPYDGNDKVSDILIDRIAALQAELQQLETKEDDNDTN